jgi:hypothetical protein
VGLYSQAPLESWGDVWSRFDAVKVMQANEDAFDAVNVMQANEAGAELEPPGAPAGEILAFDWNQLVKTSIGRNIEGITPYKPNNQPVRNNFNWVTAPNYAGGTYQFRVLIRKLSKPDAFKFIFNHWEWVPQSGGGTKLAEAVLVHPSNLSFNYTGQPIVRTFSQSIPALKSMHTVNPVKFAPWTWTIPRHLVGFFAPGSSAPLSNQLSSAALPVDMRMTVVAVAAGQTFSGWGSSTNQTFWYKHTK